MQRILDIALNDLRIIFKDRSIWINIAIIPIIIAIAVGFANGAGGSTAPSDIKIRVDVVDADQSAESATFLDNLRAANASLVLCPADQTADDLCQFGDLPFDVTLAQARLEDKVALALLEIPSGFGAALSAGENVTVIYRSNESATAPSYILQAVQAAVTRTGGVAVAARVGGQVADDFEALTFADDADRSAFVASVGERAAAVWAENPVSVDYVLASIDSNVEVTAATSGFSQSISGIATMYVMFAVLPAAAAILLERKNGTLQRLATLPLTRAQILGGKLLGRFTLGMIQYAIMFAFGALVLGVRFGSDLFALVLVMMAYTLCVTALSLALTTILKTDQQAQGIVLFMSLTLAPLGGAWWPLEIVPAWMRTFGHVSPVAWAMDSYTQLMIYGGGLGDVIVPVLVLLAATAVLFVIGVRNFRFTN